MVTLTNMFRSIVALFCLLGIASLLTYHSNAASSPPATTTAPARGYYVTLGPQTTGIDGSHAKGACAVGYHMASMYEISDPSNLTYRKTLGYNQDDSGNGPPWGVFGWARTGDVSDNGGADGPNSEGSSNCNNWTSNTSTDYGTAILILQPTYNLGGPHYSMGPWVVVASQCNSAPGVWCVQN